MERRYFGTDGIRGCWGEGCLTTPFLQRLGDALGALLREHKGDLPLSVVIGRDTRASGVLIRDALAEGLVGHGVSIEDMGVVPTPAIAQSVIALGADMGIAITASHNPSSDNGVKLFNEKGLKFDDRFEWDLEQRVDALESRDYETLPADAISHVAGVDRYVDQVAQHFPENLLQGKKIVLDTANGATVESSRRVLESLGAELVLLGNEPDGLNINDGVGSECPDLLASTVKAVSAWCGIAHDGDGDRLVICDEAGQVVHGDHLLGAIAAEWMSQGSLAHDTMVATIMSNLALDAYMTRIGASVLRVGVGDRYVIQAMLQKDLNYGGESSGHIICRNYSTTGDGLVAALAFLQFIIRNKQAVSSVHGLFTLCPQAKLNLKLAEKIPFAEMPEFQAALDKINEDLGSRGRILVRYSGTEPKIRLLAEGQDEAKVAALMNTLEALVRKSLHVLD